MRLHAWVGVLIAAVVLGCGDDDPAAPNITVSVEPDSVGVEVGQTQQFVATVMGTANQAVTWSVDGGANNGAISASGLYTAPAGLPSPATVTVRATSQADNTKSGTATVTVVAAPLPAGFVRIEPGTFQMGSPTTETDRGSDETQHWVRITKPFLLGATEVTQAQWKAVMGTDPSFFKGDNRPVERVSWLDAVNYCNALSEKEGFTKAYTVDESTVTWNQDANGYRLPTESEWEYACRAGTTTRHWSGDTESDLARVGWYSGNSGRWTHDVMEKNAPNAWGLHDVHGNVWEWCWDWYGTYQAGTPANPAENPVGATTGDYRVLRGCSWDDGAFSVRSAYRFADFPTRSNGLRGFRVARTVGP